MANDRVKVLGYAKKQDYGNGIEYRNFTPDLVGSQIASNGGTPLFTMGNFSITTNLEPKISKNFVTNKFSNFVSLTDLDLSVQNALDLLRNNAGVTLNFDKTDLSNYALFGSLTEFVRVSLEQIITNWPASLNCTPYIVNATSINNITGFTSQNYSYDALTDIATFNVSTNIIDNKFNINYLTNGTIINTYNETNDLRNLSINYDSYVILFNGVEYPVLGFTGATYTINDFITLTVKGDVFSGATSSVFKYHIKPSKYQNDLFFNTLPDFQTYLLNRKALPLYTADFNYTLKSDNGALLYASATVTWPVSDGYNIDFDTTQYEDYASQLFDICQSYDDTTSNLMVRFLVSESITSFDTEPLFLSDSDQDTSGQKINKTLVVYGRELDEINKFIQGLAYVNVVTYDKQNNTSDVYLKNLARVLGWDLISSVLENNLLANYVTPSVSTYSGQSVGLTALEADTELWRRIILNTPWIWKSKGTRKTIEFLFKFIGAPNGLINFNEHVYIANNVVDVYLLMDVLEMNNLSTDLSLYPIDEDGYPRPLENTPDLYFQNNGLWYRETGGSGSTMDVLTGNNPHVGPYDGGNKYLNQFRTLIPNFSAVTITSETSTTKVTNLFTNYNKGIMDGYTGNTFLSAQLLSGIDITDCYEVKASVIQDPKPTTLITDCGCIGGVNDSILSVGFNLDNVCNTYNEPWKIVLGSKGADGITFYPSANDVNDLSIEFDYLINFDDLSFSDALPQPVGSCVNPKQRLENFSLSVTLEVLSGSTNITVFEQPLFPLIGDNNLYNYLVANKNKSGIYTGIELISGTPTTVNATLAKNSLLNALFIESGLASNADFLATINNDAINSDWLHFIVNIDSSIIDIIANNKIKLGIKVNETCSPFKILLDNIQLNKKDTNIRINSVTVDKSQGFDLERIRDNKKSWVLKTTPTRRGYSIYNHDNTNPIRLTDYTIADSRQVLNTKEIDLDVSISSAIETDVWCYVGDNPCLLTGITAVYTATQCSQSFYSSGITAATVVTALTVTTAQTIVTSTTVTTVTSGITSGYTCPSGYSFTIGGDSCIKTSSSGATFNGSGATIVRGNQYYSYGLLGTNFYPTIQYNQALPYFNNNYILTDQTGGTVNAVTNVVSPYWGTGSTDTGRLNAVGISASTTEYLGFSKCVDISIAGTYYIGIAADNFARFRVNGQFVVDFNDGVSSFPFALWHVFPYYLNSGLNLIEMEGKNVSGPTSFGAEIYNPTSFYNLVNATNSGATGSNTIFSTLAEVNQVYDIGTSVGYSCSAGYSYNRCDTGTTGATCIQILRDVSTLVTGSTGTTASTIVTGTTVITGNTTITGTTIVSGITSTTLTSATCCVDSICGDNKLNFTNLITEPLSAITTIEDFEYIITSELIDAKNRRTISSYATLRALYDRYMNSSGTCQTNSSKFDYQSMNKFAGLVGNYWVDIIEQVIPATTIWGATKIFSNTMFDTQKYKYKPYSLQFGLDTNTQLIASNSTTGTSKVDVVVTSITANDGVNTKFSDVYLKQYNQGSQFIGKVISSGGDYYKENLNFEP
jgi:hypothetical protein